MNALIQLDQVSRCYVPHQPPAVDGVSLEVAPGEMFALLGPSGCGKTTTLRMIAGFERADAGSVTLDDRQVDGPKGFVPPERRGVGFVFQDLALFPHRSVLQNVMFGLQRRPREERRQIGRQMLEMVGLAGAEHRAVQQLSGGEQQRVALARALAPHPKVVLLDEPFSSLDAGLRDATRGEVRRLLVEQQLTAVLVTHDQQEALGFADRIAVMNAGRIEQVGTPEEIYQQPQSRFVAEFIGQTNLLQATAAGRQAQCVIGKVRLDQEAKGDVLISLRPEALQLSPAADGHTRAEVIAREYAGDRWTYHLQIGDTNLTAKADGRQRFEVCSQVAIAVTDDAVVVEDGS